MNTSGPDRFAAGLAFGCSIGFCIAWALDSEIFLKIPNEVLGAGATILAGGLAVWIGQRQIATHYRLADEQRTARLFAARATLPIALSNICRLCDQGFEAAASVLELRLDNEAREKAITSLRLADDDAKVLKECIETADASSKAWLVLILAHFQIEYSRLQSRLQSDPNVLIIAEYQAHSAAVDWIVIKGFATHLFDFSRTGDPADDELRTNLVRIPERFWHRSQEFEAAYRDTINAFERLGGLSYSAFTQRLRSPQPQNSY